MCVVAGASRPRSVVVERQTPLAVDALGVVTTVADEGPCSRERRRVAATPGGVHVDLDAGGLSIADRATSVRSRHALRRVTVALASTADREVRQSVELRLSTTASTGNRMT